ncbi:hypothetical protein Ssi02_73280 [Sinosporangium siamense]|uniref:Uncharacterized protein n=1 Tax=Sinosporangium siamense TaxID=1367973 RepID=A0A919VC06_9ACTN|nr:hypothetical protein Ssi02_73280 [Sinosporangium siamense]
MTPPYLFPKGVDRFSKGEKRNGTFRWTWAHMGVLWGRGTMAWEGAVGDVFGEGLWGDGA